MADPDADSWFLDEDTTVESANAVDENDSGDTQDAEPVAVAEAPKPPAEWRKTYKLAVSNSIVYNSYTIGIRIEFARFSFHLIFLSIFVDIVYATTAYEMITIKYYSTASNGYIIINSRQSY